MNLRGSEKERERELSDITGLIRAEVMHGPSRQTIFYSINKHVFFLEKWLTLTGVNTVFTNHLDKLVWVFKKKLYRNTEFSLNFP